MFHRCRLQFPGRSRRTRRAASKAARYWSVALSATLALVLVLAGCGSDRTLAPTGGNPSVGQEMRAAPTSAPARPTGLLNPLLSGGTQTLGKIVQGTGNLVEEGISLLLVLSAPGSSSALIPAATGGQVRYGRYTLTVPPGALAQDTIISVSDPGNGYVMCDLEPHGLQFNVPVRLQVDLTGVNVGPYSDWSVFWYNPTSGGWEDQHGVFGPNTLTADLHHFSRYAGGRVGW